MKLLRVMKSVLFSFEGITPDLHPFFVMILIIIGNLLVLFTYHLVVFSQEGLCLLSISASHLYVACIKLFGPAVNKAPRDST